MMLTHSRDSVHDLSGGLCLCSSGRMDGQMTYLTAYIYYIHVINFTF